MRNTVTTFLFGFAILGTASGLCAQSNQADLERSYFAPSKQIEVDVPKHLTVHNVFAAKARDAQQQSSSVVTNQGVLPKAQSQQPSQQPPMMSVFDSDEQLKKASADTVFENVDMAFKSLPNRRIREANYEEPADHELLQYEPQLNQLDVNTASSPMLDAHAFVIHQQASLIAQQTALLKQQTEFSQQSAKLSQQVMTNAFKVSETKLLHSAPTAEIQHEQHIQNQQIAEREQIIQRDQSVQHEQSVLSGSAQPIPSASPSRNENTITQTQLVVEAPSNSIPQRLRPPANAPTFQSVSYRLRGNQGQQTSNEWTMEPSPNDDQVTTYRWTADSGQLTKTSPSESDDMQEISNNYSGQRANPAWQDNGSQMRDRLDHFRTEDSHTNVRPGPYENRNPFGIDANSCPDEWSGFCKTRQLDLDCGCGGLKANDGTFNRGSCNTGACKTGTCNCGEPACAKRRILRKPNLGCDIRGNAACSGCNFCRGKAQLLQRSKQKFAPDCGCQHANSCSSCGS